MNRPNFPHLITILLPHFSQTSSVSMASVLMSAHFFFRYLQLFGEAAIEIPHGLLPGFSSRFDPIEMIFHAGGIFVIENLLKAGDEEFQDDFACFRRVEFAVVLVDVLAVLDGAQN